MPFAELAPVEPFELAEAPLLDVELLEGEEPLVVEPLILGPVMVVVAVVPAVGVAAAPEALRTAPGAPTRGALSGSLLGVIGGAATNNKMQMANTMPMIGARASGGWRIAPSAKNSQCSDEATAD